jgi:DNA-binding beta-propeller fold protein YncE
MGIASVALADLPPRFILKWGEYGSGEGQFIAPRGVEIGPDGNAYVVDGLNHRIQVFTSEGVFLRQWGGYGSGDGQLNDPWDLSIDSEGFIYVAEYGGNRVQKFYLDGTYVTKWGSSGAGQGQFNHCNGVAVAPDGTIYVGDLWNHRVQHFTSDGVYLGQWGGQGEADGKFYWPHALAVDEAGFVYVADTQNYRIQKFTSSGEFVLKWGTRGSADGQFERAEGISADADGNIYVSDNNLCRIQKFLSDGAWVYTWGTSGSGDGEFNRPHAIEIDPAGFLYVPDASNHRIQKFGPSIVAVSGTVASDCSGPVAGVTVDLHLDASDPFGEFLSTVTDGAGQYIFPDVASSSIESEIAVVIPLGYEAVNPPDGRWSITLDVNRTADFALGCLAPVNVARSMGYWKHQAKVWLTGKGHAQESQADMETHFPAAVFAHFYENGLNSISVEGVTYMGSPAEPLDLEATFATLSVNGNIPMVERAKQQYLPFLLNVASGKLMTSTQVASDGRTASQALQFVADLINDGNPGNDELAKDISDTINNALLVAAGLIPESYGQIAYAPPRLPVCELAVSPNPGGRSVYEFAIRLPEEGPARLDVYDVAGRRVATPLREDARHGALKVRWDPRGLNGRRLGHGVYFARLTTAEGTRTVKFVHLGQ